MQGLARRQTVLIVTKSIDDMIPKDHPLRHIRAVTDDVLSEMQPVFRSMYSKTGRPSVPPEYLLKSMILMALHSIRSERMAVRATPIRSVL